MIKRLTRGIHAGLTRIGVDSDGDDEGQLKKPLLVPSAILFIIAGIVRGVMYCAPRRAGIGRDVAPAGVDR